MDPKLKVRNASVGTVDQGDPLTITTQCQPLTPLRQKAFENIVGKGENGNQHFLLFPLCFLPL